MKKSLVIIAAVACASAQANLIVNGSFEDQAIANNSFLKVTNGQTAITGWTIGDVGVDLVSGPARWIAQDLRQSIDLAGSPGPGSISQSFATVIGQEYSVSFWLSANTEGTGDKSANYDFDGVTGNVTGGLTNGAWLQFSDTFIASTTNSTIKFQSGGGGNFGALIDNVEVEAVPEPATMLVLGVAAALATRKRKA